jgi:hypothetical protein
VLIYPRERSLFRRIFYTSHQRMLREQLRANYQIDVHEQVATRDALLGIDISGAKLLLISAHGDPFSMYFSDRRKRTLDSRDLAQLETFFARLDANATIVLQSCHTGKGFAYQVKAAAGPARRVIAARGEIPWNGLRITSLEPFDATIRCQDGGSQWDCTLRLQ